MSSEELKIKLDDWLEKNHNDWEIISFNYNVEQSKGQWKRLSKRKNNDGEEERVFENTVNGLRLLTVGNEIKGVLANGRYVFHIVNFQDEDGKFDEENGVRVSISDLPYFLKEGASSDWHVSQYTITPNFMFEDAEGDFSTEEDEKTTRKALLELGFVEREDYSQFIQECIGQ